MTPKRPKKIGAQGGGCHRELSLLPIGRLGVICDSQPHNYILFIAIRVRVKIDTYGYTGLGREEEEICNNLNENPFRLKTQTSAFSMTEWGGGGQEELFSIHALCPLGEVGPQSNQSAGAVRFLIFCSISIFLLASLVAGRRTQCRVAGNVLYHTYPLEYQICSSQPRQKLCWASVLRI